MGQINFATVLKNWLSRCNSNKRKIVALHITHLMYSLILLLSISLLFIFACLSVFTSLLHITFAVIQKRYQENFRKFELSEKCHYFLKITKQQHKLVQITGVLNTKAKTCLYGLNVSEKIKIEHFFQSKAFLHLTS